MDVILLFKNYLGGGRNPERPDTKRLVERVKIPGNDELQRMRARGATCSRVTMCPSRAASTGPPVRIRLWVQPGSRSRHPERARAHHPPEWQPPANLTPGLPRRRWACLH